MYQNLHYTCVNNLVKGIELEFCRGLRFELHEIFAFAQCCLSQFLIQFNKFCEVALNKICEILNFVQLCPQFVMR